MKKLTEKQAIQLLKKYSSSEEAFKKVLAHVQAVKKVAVRIAAGQNVDMYLIKIGSLLHDIGRFDSPPGKDRCRHGLIGAEMLRKEGVDERIALIAERHIGAGITKEDIIAQDLPLPHRDFLPISKEEKIITHADNLIFGDHEGTFEEVIERYRKELGERYVPRLVKLKEEALGKS